MFLAACAPQAPQSGVRLVLQLEGDPALLDETVEVLRNRVNATGDRFTTIEPLGADRIEVRAPGVADPRGIASFLTRPGKLAFHLVDSEADPAGYAVGVEQNGRLALRHAERDAPAVVFADPIVVNGDIASASPHADVVGNPAIELRLTPSSAEKFSRATTENINRSMAIVLDGVIVTDPVIRTPIASGGVEVTGGFTTEEAGQIALALTSGALPARLTLIETTTFGDKEGGR
jgi:preprotein translocase subunit SecD